jgi:hypothetical protein
VVATPHLLIGALVSSRRRTPAGAFLVGALSHLVADRVPHIDYDPCGLLGKLRGLADLGLGGALICSVNVSPVQLAGALGGIAPDLLSMASRDRDPFTRLVHRRIHTPRYPGLPVGIGIQAAVAAGCYAALAARASD